MAVATSLQLGSGKLYIQAHTAPQTGDDNILPKATVATAANQVGWIKGGATINYTPTVYDVKDDLGAINEHFITGEKVTIKTGLLTWNKDVIEKLVNNETAISEQGVTGLLIGAIGFNKMDKYDIYFVAEPDSANKTRSFGIIGVCGSGLNLVYQPEKETTIDVEFSATADASGHLLRIEEA